VISFKDSLLETASFTPTSLQFPDAWCGHLPFAAWLVKTIEPKIFVELGSHSGNSYFSFCQSASEANLAAKCYAVDTWQGDEHAGNYGDEVFHQVNDHNKTHYANFSRLLRMTFDDASSYFSDGSIDLLHIDGLHTYEAVKHDFETWLPKLAPGAIVLFHDTNVRERGFGVWELWEELKGRYPHNIEFLHSHGLGVLQLNGVPNAKKLHWLDSNSAEQQQLKDYFSVLGMRQLERFELGQTKIHAASLNQAVAERDGQITNLNQAVAERDGQITNLNQAVAERDGQITSLQAVMEVHQNSTSWRVTKPLRWVRSGGGRIMQYLKVMARLLGFLALNSSKVSPTINRLWSDWRSSGLAAVKQSIISIPQELTLKDVWITYQKHQKPIIARHVAEQLPRMASSPLISILIPTYETSSAILRVTLDSVLSQLYPNWELCVADDCSIQVHVRKILEEYAQRDRRIHLSFHKSNTGIAATSNRALAMAKGEYVVLLDHDDRLEEQALFRVAESILDDQPDMIYSDEALLSEDGRNAIAFVFRPAFSLELLRSHPYIVHLVAFRTALLRQLGGFDETLNISQDYDLILRVAEKARVIVHIPEVLYLWRQQQESFGHNKIDQVMAASSCLLNAHLTRCGETAEVTPGKAFNFFEVRYPLADKLQVAIIIPTKNHGELVRQCVESITRTVRNVTYDIIIIDHESTEQESLNYFAQLAKHYQVLRYKGAFNFSAINNWAVAQIEGQYSHYLFCNNDVEAIEEGWLERMLEVGQKSDVGIVGAALFYPDGHTYQHAGVCVGMYGVAEHFAKFMDKYLPDGRIHPGYIGSLITNHELSAVTAACMLMRKEVFAFVQGYDEKLTVGFGDVDLCLRTLQAGYRVIQCPHAALLHHESYTRGKSFGGDPHPQDSAFFLARWRKFLEAGDPYFNPNLSIHDTRWGTLKPMQFFPRIKRRVFRPINQ
jgi:glycosyltransferase involved in cell wall biosynthesis